MRFESQMSVWSLWQHEDQEVVHAIGFNEIVSFQQPVPGLRSFLDHNLVAYIP